MKTEQGKIFKDKVFNKQFTSKEVKENSIITTKIVNDFINSIDNKLYNPIRASKGDTECRRFLREHLREQLSLPVVERSKSIGYMLVDKMGKPITIDFKLPIYWLKNIAIEEAKKYNAFIVKIQV